MAARSDKLVILVDGSSYLHRAFHALPPLTTSKGEPTGAIYGVSNMIRKLIADYHPDHIAIVFDAKGKTFRHTIYPQYKANRPPMEEDLKVQIAPLHAIIKAMGLPLIIVDGVEADDVIGTLAAMATKHGHKVLISTGDKDMAQLVDHDVTLINTMTNTIMDAKGVKEKFGVAAENIIDYLSLVGDTSDNVPGVTGVGPKTAVKWLETYHSLDNILKHADAIKGKVGENLKNSMAHLPLTKELVTIKKDVALNLKLDDLKPKSEDDAKLAELFTHLEFKSWLANLENKAFGSTKTSTEKYLTILHEHDFAEWLKRLEHAKAFAFDLETDSLDIINAQIIGLSFAVETTEAIYIPVAHDYVGAPEQLARDFVLKQLKPILENPHKIKLGQNLKFDKNVLANYGIEVQGIGFDTMLESYVLNSGSSQHDKATLALRYLGKTITTYEDVAGKGTKQIPFNKVNLAQGSPYAAADADIVLQLHEVLWPQIQKTSKLEDVFKNIEMPLLSVLARMERIGVAIDQDLLAKQSKELALRLREIEHAAYKIATCEFNLNSPLQLQQVLFEKLQLPILQKTPTKQPSTAEAVLQELALDYELPKLILEYRSLSKLKSTYTDALPLQVNSKTNRVHTSYNQAVTSTGRLSSTNPNLQNIPIRTEEGRKIRKAFIASKGYKLISADYSQIELRIMAHLSHDHGLINAFTSDEDIHRATAAEVFGAKLKDVTSTQRRDAKTINFGLIYGMSAYGLAKRLNMTREAAEKYIALYFARYPGVKDYMEKMREFARNNGFVETLCGRRLYIPEIHAKNFARRSAAERTAINAPMQGTAADIMKLAMIHIDQWIKECKLDIKMIMQVHDELIFEVANDDVTASEAKIKKLMENAMQLAVPVIVHVGVGDNWDEAH
ncbi:MAG: DNA polymerase I [Gammaproteobacteria bacterium]|nr:DNA polymerase I [Gammaproteobacteria bacterium]